MTYGATKKSTNMRLLLGVVILIGILASTAFTASNTIPESYAGTGTTTISGVEVTSIAYDLDGAREQIEGVTFQVDGDLSGTDAEAEVRLVSGGDWYSSCDFGDFVSEQTALDCTIDPTVSLSDADELTLVVAH